MKGLIFSEPMMKAWLEGRKLVTRRLMKPQPTGHPWEYNPSHRLEHTMLLTNKGWYCKFWHQIAQNPLPDGEQWIRAPYQPGETVYIKETWAVDKKYNHLPPSKIPIEGRRPVYYKALYDDEYANAEKPPNLGRWRSPRFMPEWAAISHALIKSVRPPERVQEINGVFHDEILKEGWPFPGIFTESPYKDFSILWESLHPGSWERNDFVWPIELKKQEEGK